MAEVLVKTEKFTNIKFISLEGLANFEMGQSPDSLSINDLGDGVPFLQGCAEFGEIIPDHTYYCSQPRKLCKANDILISVRAPVGTLNKADRVYCIGRGLAAIRFNNSTLPEFGWHLLNYWVSNLKKVAQGSTFEAISKTDLNNLSVSYFPDTFEQKRIAEILDSIDQAIASTASLISKLKQMKAGLLNDLLTRGLDENGKLRDPIQHPKQFKDSELGRIPKDWEIRYLEECVKPDAPITYGIVQAGPNIEGGIPYIRTGDMAGDKLSREGLLRTSPQIAASYRRSEVKTGEIVCAIRATVGKVLEVPPELNGANLTQGTARIAPREDINNHFLLWLFQSSYIKHQFSFLVKGTTFSEITLKNLRKIKIALPTSKSEQNKLAEFLDGFNNRICTEKVYLEKLKLQKKGLMQDLLTGKVRIKP